MAQKEIFTLPFAQYGGGITGYFISSIKLLTKYPV